MESFNDDVGIINIREPMKIMYICMIILFYHKSNILDTSAFFKKKELDIFNIVLILLTPWIP